MTKLDYVNYSESGSVSVSYSQNVYIVNASSNCTYTLPENNVDGVKFVFSRIDNTINSVTIQVPPSSNNRITERTSVFTTSMNINPLLTVEFHSFQGVWYVLYKSDLLITGTTIMNATYTSNSGLPGISYSSNSIILYFPYSGASSGVLINNISFNTSSVTTKNFVLGYGPNIIANIPNNNNQIFNYSLTSSEKTLLPLGPTVLFISLGTVPSNVIINSIVVS